MARIAFVGLGNMGLGMAARLIETGHQLSVYNRTASRAEALVRQGAQLFDSPKRACQGVDAVISMVADDSASRAVWLGMDGILAAANFAKNGFAIECSTLSHDWVAELSSLCGARGLRYLDAPVTGLPDVATAGALTLLVGADADDLSSARDILDSLAQRIIRFGPVGAGTAYKLIINMMGAVQIASAAEALAIAERVGLNIAAVADAISTSQAASPQVVRNTRRMVADDHDHNVVFSSALRLKDVEYAIRFARASGIGSPFGALAERMYRRLCEMGYAHVNESKVIEVCRSQVDWLAVAGQNRRGRSPAKSHDHLRPRPMPDPLRPASPYPHVPPRDSVRTTMAAKSKTGSRKVERAMHEMKLGKLKSGRSGKTVTSRKQAIAIGLSEARKSGAKIPKKKKSTRKK